jgi:hypothetical protein
MQKMIGMILVGILIVLGTSACSGEKTPEVKEYLVVQITGLYDQFSLSATQIRALVPGTKLIPADGATEVTCESLGDIGLCHVQVVESGETGWVESDKIIKKD